MSGNIAMHVYVYVARKLFGYIIKITKKKTDNIQINIYLNWTYDKKSRNKILMIIINLKAKTQSKNGPSI